MSSAERGGRKGKNGLRDIQNESRKNAIARGIPADQAELAFVTPAPKDSSVRPKSTIDNYKTAEQHFTAKRLHAINECREAKEDCYDSVSKEADNELLKTYLTEYDTISDDDKQLWELKRREQHLLGKAAAHTERHCCGPFQQSSAIVPWFGAGHWSVVLAQDD